MEILNWPSVDVAGLWRCRACVAFDQSEDCSGTRVKDNFGGGVGWTGWRVCLVNCCADWAEATLSLESIVSIHPEARHTGNSASIQNTGWFQH